MTQTLTVGEMPLKAGGVIMLAHMMMDDGGSPQVDDPKEDNYVTCRSSNPRVKLTSHPVPWAGMHGGFREPQPTPDSRWKARICNRAIR